MEKMADIVSRLVPANDSPEAETVASAPSDEPRRLKKDEAERILYEAQRTQERWGMDAWDLPKETGPAPALYTLVEKAIEGQSIPEDQREKLLTVARQRQDQADAQRRDANLKTLSEAVGCRFAGATLENYQATMPEQEKILASIKEYADHIQNTAGNGDGIILFGNAGTGKTHLLTAVAKRAVEAGLSIAWTNGQELFAQFRGAIDGEGSESRIVKKMVESDVLVLDDLLPPGGALSEYQAICVYRIIDSRYRDMKSTWATMNVADGDEAARGMGTQVVDRLRHEALTLFCNWPSYRKAKGK